MQDRAEPRARREPRLPFRWTVNPYRGCSHSCHYCFARAYHAYLDLGVGEDFSSKIVVKTNVVEVLRARARVAAWTGETVAMGTATDPYQHCEGRYRLTRGRPRGARRLREPALDPHEVDADPPRPRRATGGWTRRPALTVSMSVGTLDEEVRRVVEPGTPPGRKRLEILARFADAGIRTGVLVAPILPGLTDDEEHLDEVLAACAAAGVAVGVADRPARAPGDPRALHAVAARGVSVALPALRGAVRAAGVRPKSYQKEVAERFARLGCATGSWPAGAAEPARARRWTRSARARGVSQPKVGPATRRQGG